MPPFYTARVGAVWRPFIERDWPYFRRQRVARLRRLSRFRQLTPKEVEELEGFTYDELRDAMGVESRELAHAAAQYAERGRTRPRLDDAVESMMEDMGELSLSSSSWAEQEREGSRDNGVGARDAGGYDGLDGHGRCRGGLHAEDICLNTSLPDDALVEDVTATPSLHETGYCM